MSKTTRRVWAAAAALALFSLGVSIRGQMPNPNDRVFAQFNYEGYAPTLGTVENVHSFVTESFNEIPSNVSWLVVDFTFTPDASTGVITGQVEAADGALFDPAYGWTKTCGVVYPGLTVDCTLVFEMPEEKIEGATLYVHVPGTQMRARSVVKLEAPEPHAALERERMKQ